MSVSTTGITGRGSLLLAGACLQWASLAAEAASGAWRCGNTYSDRPCQEGRPLDIEDSRSAEQRLAADQITRDARSSADRMERDRQRLESRAGLAIELDDRAFRPRQPDSSTKKSVSKLLKPRKDPQYLSPGERPTKKQKKKKKSAPD